jgi:membrane-bound lytic murein transglycosylase D
VQTFLDNLESHEAKEKPLSAWKTYTLKKGDKLESVAAHYNITTAYLKQLNGIGPRSKTAPGMTLLVPGKDAMLPVQFAALDAKLPDAPSEPAGKTVCSKDKKGHKTCRTVTTAKSNSSAKSAKSTEKAPAKAATKASAAKTVATKPAGKSTSKPAPAPAAKNTKKK